MSVKVHLSSHVRAYTAGQKMVEADGTTLADVLADLERHYPGIRFRIVDEQDRPRQHMNFFVGGKSVRDLTTPVASGQEVHILGALSGG